MATGTTGRHMSQEIQNAGTAGRPFVFLSYARADRPRVAALAGALQAAGLDVWWDREIKGGEAFAERIESALDRADAVIVAWSQTAVASDWVRDEAGHGRDRKRLVPVSLDGTLPPLGFRQYHALDLSQWRGASHGAEIASVVAAVRARMGEDVALPPAPSPAHPLMAWSRRNWMLSVAAAGAVVAGGIGVAAWRGLAPPVANRSVAVLPFKNLTGDPQQQYFSDGLSDEMRAALARDRDLRVMGQVSSALAGGDDMKAVADRLGVAFVLNGAVQRAGDIVRISAELTDRSGYSKWAQSFDRSIKDIFAIQSEIASVVLAALTAQVNGGAPKPAITTAEKAYGGTTDVEAYQAYLRGRGLFQRDDGEPSERAALAQFEQAIKRDPGFAVARAARARTLDSIASSYARADQVRALYDEAIAEANTAQAAAPDSAYIQATLGMALLEGRLDIRAASGPFEKALALGGNDASALSSAGNFAAQTGRTDDGLAALTRAQDIDPLNPLIHRMAGLIRMAARQFDDALPPLQKSLALQPKLSVSHAAIAQVRLHQGRLDDALAAWQAEPSEMLHLSGLAIVQRGLGHTSDAQAAFDALVAKYGDNALYQQAQVKAQWGDIDGAMQLLLRARAAGDDGLLRMKMDALLDPLRPDPRFSRLLTDIGFT